jgi:hypothetical protein
LKYGLHRAWSTPIKRVNLLKRKIVDPALHAWLEDYADDPSLISGALAPRYDSARQQTRYNLSVFVSPRRVQLARIKQILIAQADEFARQAIVDPLPEHEKLAYFWFVIQHPNDPNEAIRPHFHEPGDIALVYYLSTPANRSGTLVLVDPRGTIERGGRALPRHVPALEFTPEPGDVLIFPRYLMHYTTVNTDARDRKVIGGVLAYDLPRRSKDQYLVKARRAPRAR